MIWRIKMVVYSFLTVATPNQPVKIFSKTASSKATHFNYFWDKRTCVALRVLRIGQTISHWGYKEIFLRLLMIPNYKKFLLQNCWHLISYHNIIQELKSQDNLTRLLWGKCWSISYYIIRIQKIPKKYQNQRVLPFIPAFLSIKLAKGLVWEFMS